MHQPPRPPVLAVVQRGSLSLMALLLSAAGFLPAQNLVDILLDGLQLRVPLFLFVVGVIQAGFLGNKLLDLVLQRFPGGSLVMPCSRKYRAAASAMIKSLSCACRYARGALGDFCAFSPSRAGLVLA